MPNKIANVCWNEQCGATYDAAAQACPNCGAPARDPRAKCPNCRKRIGAINFRVDPLPNGQAFCIIMTCPNPACECFLGANIVPPEMVMEVRSMGPEIDTAAALPPGKMSEILANLRKGRGG